MGGKSGGDVPQAPDFEALANQQTFTDRPNQIAPWGRMQWNPWTVTDPTTGQEVTRWQQVVDLDPTIQDAYQHQFDRDWHLADLGQKAAHQSNFRGIFGRIRDISEDPLDYAGIREVEEIESDPRLRRRAEDAAYGRATSRLDPQWRERRQAQELKLRNQGLRPGDEAYDRAVANLSRAEADAYSGARLESTAEGRREAMDEYQRQFSRQAQSAALREAEMAERLRMRQDPYQQLSQLHEIAARGTVPQWGFSGYPRGGDYQRAGASQYQSQLDAYNADQAQRQSLMSGLFGLGGNIASAAMLGGMFSDRRLKRDIVRVGTWRGHGLYLYRYLTGELGFGVMADEVNPDAVRIHESGFALVDYSKVR